MNTDEQKMQIARTILKQLGGHKFVVMTGARRILGLDAGLRFDLAGTITKKHINRITIDLESNDTYTMKFYNIRRANAKMITQSEGVYGDMLRDVFTAETGLDTSL